MAPSDTSLIKRAKETVEQSLKRSPVFESIALGTLGAGASYGAAIGAEHLLHGWNYGLGKKTIDGVRHTPHMKLLTHPSTATVAALLGATSGAIYGVGETRRNNELTNKLMQAVGPGPNQSDYTKMYGKALAAEGAGTVLGSLAGAGVAESMHTSSSPVLRKYMLVPVIAGNLTGGLSGAALGEYIGRKKMEKRREWRQRLITRLQDEKK